MRRQAYGLLVIVLIGGVLGAYLVGAGAIPTQFNLVPGEGVPEVRTPDGFELTVFVEDLAAPRFMTYHPTTETLLVSERGAGRIIGLRDADNDQIADEIIEVVDGLVAPTGIDFVDGWLYIAEASDVRRVQLDDDMNVITNEVIIEGLPAGRSESELPDNSNTHALVVHNDEIYISVGAICAACRPSDSRRAAVLVYNVDGSNERVFARGLYYAQGLAIEPITGAVLAANQGRPQLDEDVPETLYILQNGDDVGWPRCHAGTIIDPDEGSDGACDDVAQPVARFAAQANVTDITFFNHPDAPADYQGDLLVALHGGVQSNELQVGMEILRLDFENGQPVTDELESFISGWRLSDEPGDWLGRPMGLLMAPDGSLYITDDGAGVVYQVRFVDE